MTQEEDPNYIRLWLAKARVTDDPEGDLVADMRTEPDIPDFATIEKMRSYVSFKSHGDRKILAAVPGVWRRYQRWIYNARYRQDGTFPL